MKNKKLDLEELQRKVEELISKETPESLSKWIEEDRRKQALRDEIADKYNEVWENLSK